MGVTEMTKMYHLCEMYKITDQDGFGLAVWDIIHAIVLAHDCAME